jgi:phenylacetate-coenzyme A ligase PaaK-like adenylate-forming protein
MGHDNPAAHEWYPYSREDFLEIAPKLSRLSKMAGLRSGDIVLAIVDTPPMISSFIPYLWSTSEASKHLKLEFIIGSLEWYDTLGMTWINFIQKRKPKVVFSSTSNALAFAQKVQKTNRSVRDLLPEVRLGIFYGEQPETGNVRIHEAYAGIERFEGFSPIEHFAFCTECQDHSGIHIWLDSCIPEVLPMESSKAKYLSETQRGTIGELVITNFAKALPIIRYRTGKAVIVQETQSCKCGCNHPKVKFC